MLNLYFGPSLNIRDCKHGTRYAVGIRNIMNEVRNSNLVIINKVSIHFKRVE